MNIDAEELLAQIRKDFPTQYQLAHQQVTIAKQERELQRLSAELAAVRDGDRAFGVARPTDTADPIMNTNGRRTGQHSQHPFVAVNRRQ